MNDETMRPNARDEVAEFSRPIRKVTSLTPVDHYLNGSWDALGSGAPVLVALAQLTSQAFLDRPKIHPETLSGESLAILYSARGRGTIEIKGSNTAFEASSRMLAVYVEIDETQTIAFRDPECPETTIRFLEAFRDLCSMGLVLHHSHRDFSLTKAGFELARSIKIDDVRPWLSSGREFGLHE